VRESSVQSTSAATLPDLGPTQAKGRLRGKQPKLNQRQEAHLVALFKGGEYSTAELAELFGVARSTVYRACERAGSRESDRRHGWLTGCDVPQAAALRDGNILVASETFGHRSWFLCGAGWNDFSGCGHPMSIWSSAVRIGGESLAVGRPQLGKDLT
jgi:hypothetical protein